jgi:hypothetical protein
VGEAIGPGRALGKIRAVVDCVHSLSCRSAVPARQNLTRLFLKMLDWETFRQMRDSLEVRLDVMLCTTEPRFKSCDKRILADLNQAGCP